MRDLIWIDLMLSKKNWLARTLISNIGYFQILLNPCENGLKQIQLILNKKRIAKEEQTVKIQTEEHGIRKYLNYDNEDYKLNCYARKSAYCGHGE